jgi:hypothetical protein
VASRGLTLRGCKKKVDQVRALSVSRALVGGRCVPHAVAHDREGWLTRWMPLLLSATEWLLAVRWAVAGPHGRRGILLHSYSVEDSRGLLRRRLLHAGGQYKRSSSCDSACVYISSLI